MKHRFTSYVVLAVLLASCGNNDATEPALSPADDPASEVDSPATAGVRQGLPDAVETFSGEQLAGSNWQLVQIMEMDDTTHQPDDPMKYTLKFGINGTANLRLDCNRGTASWTANAPGKIRFGPVASTKAMCPPGSLHDVFLSQFEWIRSYIIRDDHLFLATMADGSIIEFSPMRDALPAASVLGKPIHTDNSVEMQSAILTALFDQYRAQHGIEATDGEIDAFLEHIEALKRTDIAERTARLNEIADQLESTTLESAAREKLESERSRLADFLANLTTDEQLTTEEQAQLRNMQRSFARGAIEQWKLNKALYKDFGGRIIYQQGGPEPLDAYLRFLKKRQEAGAFTIYNTKLESQFWRYFTDASIHTFMDPDSEDAARAFSIPPWHN